MVSFICDCIHKIRNIYHLGKSIHFKSLTLFTDEFWTYYAIKKFNYFKYIYSVHTSCTHEMFHLQMTMGIVNRVQSPETWVHGFTLWPEVSNPSGSIVFTIFCKAESAKKNYLFCLANLHHFQTKMFSYNQTTSSITFPQWFQIFKFFWSFDFGKGGQKERLIKRYLKSEQTDGHTDRQTHRQTFWLIESIGPLGRCFENKAKYPPK